MMRMVTPHLFIVLYSVCGPPKLRGHLHDNNMCTQLGSGKDGQLCSLAVPSYLISTNGSSLPPPSLSLPSQEVDCHGNGGWNKPWKKSKTILPSWRREGGVR